MFHISDVVTGPGQSDEGINMTGQNLVWGIMLMTSWLILYANLCLLYNWYIWLFSPTVQFSPMLQKEFDIIIIENKYVLHVFHSSLLSSLVLWHVRLEVVLSSDIWWYAVTDIYWYHHPSFKIRLWSCRETGTDLISSALGSKSVPFNGGRRERIWGHLKYLI